MKKTILLPILAALALPSYVSAQDHSASFDLTAKVDPVCRLTTGDRASRINDFQVDGDFGTLQSTNSTGGGNRTKLATITRTWTDANRLEHTSPATSEYKFFVACNPNAGATLTYARKPYLARTGTTGSDVADQIAYDALVRAAGSASFVNKNSGDSEAISAANMGAAANRSIEVKFEVKDFLDVNGFITKAAGLYADTFTVSVQGF
ncbi:hypothetical protein [Neomegalonema sp.]|uniref:hypothetical protein n=1 Tax=Neomegalonema sp. TaxID=2039713 RepID=UPI002609DFF5|nr:hypothetical protein [Neomegalonema sp.]MDD2867737.1 hypothetical protein [Neomegalonema sp.]